MTKCCAVATRCRRSGPTAACTVQPRSVSFIMTARRSPATLPESAKRVRSALGGATDDGDRYRNRRRRRTMQTLHRKAIRGLSVLLAAVVLLGPAMTLAATCTATGG